MNIAPVLNSFNKPNLVSKNANYNVFLRNNKCDSVLFTGINKSGAPVEPQETKVDNRAESVLHDIDGKTADFIEKSNYITDCAEVLREEILNKYRSEICFIKGQERFFKDGEPIVGGREAARIYDKKDGKIIMGRVKEGVVTKVSVHNGGEESEYSYKENGELEKYKNKKGSDHIVMRFGPNEIEYKKKTDVDLKLLGTGIDMQSSCPKEHILIRMDENGKIRYAEFMDTLGQNKTILQKKKTEGGFIVSKTENEVKTEELVKSND